MVTNKRRGTFSEAPSPPVTFHISFTEKLNFTYVKTLFTINGQLGSAVKVVKVPEVVAAVAVVSAVIVPAVGKVATDASELKLEEIVSAIDEADSVVSIEEGDVNFVTYDGEVVVNSAGGEVDSAVEYVNSVVAEVDSVVEYVNSAGGEVDSVDEVVVNTVGGEVDSAIEDVGLMAISVVTVEVAKILLNSSIEVLVGTDVKPHRVLERVDE